MCFLSPSFQILIDVNLTILSLLAANLAHEKDGRNAFRFCVLPARGTAASPLHFHFFFHGLTIAHTRAYNVRMSVGSSTVGVS